MERITKIGDAHMIYVKYDCWIQSQGDFDFCNRLNEQPMTEWNGTVGPYHKVLEQIIQERLENMPQNAAKPQIDAQIVKAIESVLAKGDRAGTPLKCDCGKMIARARNGKVFLWCKQCRKEVELKFERESHYEPRTDN